MRSFKADRETRVKKLQTLWKKEFDEDLTYRLTRSILQHVKGFKHTHTLKNKKHKKTKDKKTKSKTSKAKKSKGKTSKRKTSKNQKGGAIASLDDAYSGLAKDLPEGNIITGFTGGHHPKFPIEPLPKEIPYGVDTTIPKELQGQGP